MKIQQCSLTEARHLFTRFAEISADVYDTIGVEFDADGYPDVLEGWAKRGHSVAHVEDDAGAIVGFYLAGPSASFTSGTDWLPVKMELVRDGQRPDDFMVTHACHVHPAFWKQGLTLDLLKAVMGARPEPMHLIIDCATPELEAWAAAMPGVTALQTRSPIGKTVMVQPASAMTT